MNESDAKQSFVNSRQIFGLLSLIDKNKNNSKILLKDVLSDFEKNYKVDIYNHYFCNQHSLLFLLVSHLMVVKETHFEKINEKIKIKSLPERWSIKNKNLGDMSLKILIRRLRNSICHANFKISEDLKIVFIDENKFKKNDNFQIEFSDIELLNFLQSFAYFILTNDENLKELNS